MLILGSRFLDEGLFPQLVGETGFYLNLVRAMITVVRFIMETLMLPSK